MPVLPSIKFTVVAPYTITFIVVASIFLKFNTLPLPLATGNVTIIPADTASQINVPILVDIV